MQWTIVGRRMRFIHAFSLKKFSHCTAQRPGHIVALTCVRIKLYLSFRFDVEGFEVLPHFVTGIPLGSWLSSWPLIFVPDRLHLHQCPNMTSEAPYIDESWRATEFTGFRCGSGYTGLGILTWCMLSGLQLWLQFSFFVLISGGHSTARCVQRKSGSLGQQSILSNVYFQGNGCLQSHSAQSFHSGCETWCGSLRTLLPQIPTVQVAQQMEARISSNHVMEIKGSHPTTRVLKPFISEIQICRIWHLSIVSSNQFDISSYQIPMVSTVVASVEGVSTTGKPSRERRRYDSLLVMFAWDMDMSALVVAICKLISAIMRSLCFIRCLRPRWTH